LKTPDRLNDVSIIPAPFPALFLFVLPPQSPFLKMPLTKALKIVYNGKRNMPVSGMLLPRAVHAAETERMMSFSSSAKENLVKIRVKSRSQRLAQLAGLTHTCGALYVGRGRGAVYSTETLAVGKHILSLASSLFELESIIELNEREHRRPLTVVTLLGEQAERLLCETGLLCQKDGGIDLGGVAPETLLVDEEARRAFLRGTFLGSGSCANPYRGYHLEIIARSAAFAAQVRGMIESFGLDARSMERKERFVVYLKGDDVSGFLALIGASGSALKFENVRTERDFRNYVNRTNNCDTANIGKTVNASALQRQAIEIIEEHMGLTRLPGTLYEAAVLRMNHPDATLQELADLAEIGKSGMNHRLTRLIRIAREIQNG
jgi:DNA-binding protein WhiA